METGAESRPLVQLLSALKAEGIPYMLVGMSAANLQGILISTIDVDVWIGLPTRQYMRVLNLCRRLGATPRSRNKVFLSDDTPVDFIYEVSGLPEFDREYHRALRLPFHGLTIPVLPLERIRKSKQAAGRDKDALHILLINKALKLKNDTKPKRTPRRPTKKPIAKHRVSQRK
jgi:hypothetical protein